LHGNRRQRGAIGDGDGVGGCADGELEREPEHAEERQCVFSELELDERDFVRGLGRLDGT
jgi:hypothetical protein